MNWKTVSDSKLLCSVGEKQIFYNKGTLYIQENQNEYSHEILKLPISWWKSIAIKIRLLERLLRLEPRVAISLNDHEFLLSYQGQIFKINCENRNFEPEHHYRRGMNNTLSFCNLHGSILYGEYFGNSQHEGVCIFRRQLKGKWEKVFTFQPGSVGHIHRIIYDQYRECLWVLTGDSDQESGIWKVDVDFREATPVFIGKQKYRSCFLAAYKDGLLYATDTPLDENAIYFSWETSEGHFQEPELVYPMPGPCIYGTHLHGDMVAMSTSVEPDVSLPTWRYRITTKLGKGIHDRSSHLIIGSMNTAFREFCQFKKDIHGMWLFQFGNLLFPDIDCSDAVFITGQALEKIDGKTICVSPFEEKKGN